MKAVYVEYLRLEGEIYIHIHTVCVQIVRIIKQKYQIIYIMYNVFRSVSENIMDTQI